MEKHAEVTSEIRTYQTDDFFKENYTDSLFTDYIELSYKEYQKKYGYNRKDMDRMAYSAGTSLSILKANRSIENLNTKLKNFEIKEIDTTFLNRKYAFDSLRPLKFFQQFDSIVPLDTLK